MAETLVRVVGADEQTATFLPGSSLSWLAQTDIMHLLLTKLVPYSEGEDLPCKISQSLLSNGICCCEQLIGRNVGLLDLNFFSTL